MRLILLPLFASAVMAPVSDRAPVEAPAAKADSMMPAYTQPARAWTSVEDVLASKQCGDRIEQVREAAGQPALDKTPATPGEGYMIAAVDKRIDGCAVMQMKGDVNDLRPLPPAPESPARLQPAG